MTDKILESEFFTFFVKFIVIPLFAVGVKLSVANMKDGNKISKTNIVLSFFVGIAVPFILRDVIQSQVPKDFVTLTIGVVAILGDKITEAVIKRVQIDLFITSLSNNLFTFIVNILKPKQ